MNFFYGYERKKQNNNDISIIITAGLEIFNYIYNYLNI